ncbi:hypothetical protein ALC60_13649, partial [Trachymyrmex zeteki]
GWLHKRRCLVPIRRQRLPSSRRGAVAASRKSPFNNARNYAAIFFSYLPASFHDEIIIINDSFIFRLINVLLFAVIILHVWSVNETVLVSGLIRQKVNESRRVKRHTIEKSSIHGCSKQVLKNCNRSEERIHMRDPRPHFHEFGITRGDVTGVHAAHGTLRHPRAYTNTWSSQQP